MRRSPQHAPVEWNNVHLTMIVVRPVEWKNVHLTLIIVRSVEWKFL